MLSTRLEMAVILAVSLTATSVCRAEGPQSAPVAYPHGASLSGSAYNGGYGAGAYPTLNAPLYPSPVQHVPGWAGGTIVTNQALAPHEMLYPHAYHAMYPPFYYRVQGCWIVTPFGVRQHENWKLEGTHVKVKYRDHYRPFSQFSPPVTH